MCDEKKEWCKFCGRTFEVKDYICKVCAWKLPKGLTINFPIPIEVEYSEFVLKEKK
jgi:hypothetical protein